MELSSSQSGIYLHTSSPKATPGQSGRLLLLGVAFLPFCAGFPLGSTVRSETKGIWMLYVHHPSKENHTLVLLNTEGLGNVEKVTQGIFFTLETPLAFQFPTLIWFLWHVPINCKSYYEWWGQILFPWINSLIKCTPQLIGINFIIFNTGVKDTVKVSQSCPTLCNPMDYTVHGILQARILEWVAFPFSRGPSNPEIQPRSPEFQADSLPADPHGKPKNTGVGSLSLLQRIFLTQKLNRGLLHCRWIL